MCKSFFKFKWWKLVIAIIIEIIILYAYRINMPICGYPPDMVNPPRCASTLTDILLGIMILIILYIIIMVIYKIKSKITQ